MPSIVKKTKLQTILLYPDVSFNAQDNLPARRKYGTDEAGFIFAGFIHCPDYPPGTRKEVRGM